MIKVQNPNCEIPVVKFKNCLAEKGIWGCNPVVFFVE